MGASWPGLCGSFYRANIYEGLLSRAAWERKGCERQWKTKTVKCEKAREGWEWETTVEVEESRWAFIYTYIWYILYVYMCTCVCGCLDGFARAEGRAGLEHGWSIARRTNLNLFLHLDLCVVVVPVTLLGHFTCTLLSNTI